MKIGVIGLGRMGGPLAGHLIKGGHQVFIRDVRPEACAPLAAHGAHILDSPAAVARQAEAIVTSLPGPKEVEATMTGAGGILSAIAPGALVVATSTVAAEQSRRHAQLLAAKGAAHLDAPISGGVEGAEAGTLTVMVGGEAEAFARARPLLECFGREIFHVGPSGAGNDMKLIIQMMFGSMLAIFMEGVALSEAMGLKIDRMLEILGTSSAHHPSIGRRYDKIIADDLSPRSPLSMFAKDLALVRERCHGAGLEAPLVEAVAARYAGAMAAGLGAKDVIALRRLYDKSQGD